MKVLRWRYYVHTFILYFLLFNIIQNNKVKYKRRKEKWHGLIRAHIWAGNKFKKMYKFQIHSLFPMRNPFSSRAWNIPSPSPFFIPFFLFTKPNIVWEITHDWSIIPWKIHTMLRSVCVCIKFLKTNFPSTGSVRL